MSNKIAIIGGGAAGFFSALSAKFHDPKCEVVIFEKSSKLLSKVKISGGGRCNVTNATFDNNLLAKNYPRGEHFLKKAFHQFSVKDTFEWFKKRNVQLEILEDGCVFPKSNSSQTIIDCFLEEAKKLNITITTNTLIKELYNIDNRKVNLITEEAEHKFDKVIICIGGTPKLSSFQWLSKLNLNIIPPVPSLFTFNIPNNPIVELMGIVVEHAKARIVGSKLASEGPLLITHWGLSGPCILKLSAFGARILAEKHYNFTVLVSWINENQIEKVNLMIKEFINLNSNKNLSSLNPFNLQKRLWMYLLSKAGLNIELTWKDLGQKSINKLTEILLNDPYEVKGKTTFKEEFVTAGGFSLQEINVKTMESKVVPNIYFAGEVMDIDGITGGFNFQAAWTTAWIAGRNSTTTS